MDRLLSISRKNSGYLASAIFLLFIFCVPRVSAHEFSFSISPTQNSVNEGDGSISIKAELSGGPSFDSSCRVTGEIGIKERSTAKQGEDFEIADGAFDLLIPQEFVNDFEPFAARSAIKANSRSSKSITIKITQDQQLESDEVIELIANIESEGCNPQVVENEATITILDDEVNDLGDIHFKKSIYTVREDEGTVTLELARRVGNTGTYPVTITISTESGTAKDGEDYTGITNRQIEFVGDLLTQEVDITIESDDVVEEDESFSVSLSGSFNENTTNTTRVTIVDSTEPGSVGFSNNTFNGEEGGLAEIQVMREQGSDGEFSVELKVGAEGDTATAGKDYKKPENTQITWAAGDNEPKTITIPVLKFHAFKYKQSLINRNISIA